MTEKQAELLRALAQEGAYLQVWEGFRRVRTIRFRHGALVNGSRFDALVRRGWVVSRGLVSPGETQYVITEAGKQALDSHEASVAGEGKVANA